jgi:hypothetical protein
MKKLYLILATIGLAFSSAQAATFNNFATTNTDPVLRALMASQYVVLSNAGNWNFGSADTLGESIYSFDTGGNSVSNAYLFRVRNNGTDRVTIGNSGLVSIGTITSSNYVVSVLRLLASTNSTASTNLTVDFKRGVVDLYPTNHMTFTNFLNVPTTNGAAVVTYQISPQGADYTVTYPTLGGSSFGVRCLTNAGSPMRTTLSNGWVYRLTWDTIGTNISLTLSGFQ